MKRPFLSLGACATLACQWEATAPKPGNVYRGADFADMTYVDLLTSAAVIGPIIDRSDQLGLGPTLLAGVQATQQVVGVNTNLGTLLLLVPLALAHSTSASPQVVIEQATEQDTRQVYEAIRLASPGGLGEVANGDVRSKPHLSLLESMQLAADRDLVARQYTNDFAEVRGAADSIAEQLFAGRSLSEAIVQTYVGLLAKHGDSLVERKLGQETSRELASRAREVLSKQTVLSKPDLANSEQGEDFQRSLADFDFWLRSEGHRRNPGTTADLIAGALFALLLENGLLENRLSWPVRFYSSSP